MARLFWRSGLSLLVVGLGLVAAISVSHGEEAPKIETYAPDLGFGEHELSEEARFARPQGLQGRADRRSELNPLAHRTISWPSGYNAPRGTVTVSNQLLVSNRIDVAVDDKATLFATAFLPVISQTYLGGGGQLIASEGDAWKFAVGLQGRYRRTNYIPGTADAGLGLYAAFDVVATDNTTWTAGISTNIPVYRYVEDVDLSECDNRREWAEGLCGELEEVRQFVPNSGYWTALYLGAHHFVTDWLVLNAELFTGTSQGNFFALQSALNSDLSYESERRIVEDTSWNAGPGPLGLLTLGLGSTWTIGPVGIQTAIYFLSYDGSAVVLPHFSMGANFGG